MTPEIQTIKLSQVAFDENIYPRKQHNDSLVQKYIDCLEEIEARGNYISVAADFSLLDGRHRHLAYLRSKNGSDPDINVFLYDITEEKEKVSLATELNSEHGDQLSIEDKKMMVIRFYSKYGFSVEEAAKKVRVRKEKALEWTKAIREEEERRLNEKLFLMWLACNTLEEIGQATDLPVGTLKTKITEEWLKKFPGTKSTKLSNFELETNEKSEELPDETGWKRPLYNVWTFAKKSNNVSHFGNSEQRILENLLYLYTKPFDIVLDPFAGGGSTIDGYLFLRRWFPDRRQLRLLAPESEVFIEGNCLVSYDAGYNYGRRCEDMTDWYNDKNTKYRYERRRRGFLVEQHVKNFFMLHYPEYYRPASNEGNYKQSASDDFSLVIPSQIGQYRIVIDVKTFSDSQEESNNGVIRNIKNNIIYLWADWFSDESVKLYGLGDGKYLKLLGLESGDLTVIQDKHLLDIDILFVVLNMAKMGIDYKHYKNKIGFYAIQAVSA